MVSYIFMRQVRDIRHQLASSLAQLFVVVVIVGQCDGFMALTTKLFDWLFNVIVFLFFFCPLAKDNANVSGLCRTS